MDEPLPWQAYNSDDLYTGWVYPARRDDIADALRESGAEIGRAKRSIPGRSKTSSSILLRASFYSASRSGYTGGEIRSNPANLYIHAVQRDELDLALTHIQTWLPQASKWLAEGAKRGNAWLASAHDYTVYFSGSEAWAVES